MIGWWNISKHTHDEIWKPGWDAVQVLKNLLQRNSGRRGVWDRRYDGANHGMLAENIRPGLSHISNQFQAPI